MSNPLLDTAVDAARVGGAILRRYFRETDLEVRHKSEHDFVSKADHESEEAIAELICSRFPEHSLLAEEGGFRHDGGGDHEWIVDPLDGTSNFLQGLPVWCVSVACRRREDGEVVVGVVYDPLGENLFQAAVGEGAFWNGRPMRAAQRPGLDGAFLSTGYPFNARAALDLYLDVFRAVFLRARSIRRCGSAALDLAYTAAGVYDGFFEFRLSPWDFAAGILLQREAGGRITDLDGGENFFVSGNLIAGPPALHRELLEVVREFVDEAGLDAVEPRDPSRIAPVRG